LTAFLLDTNVLSELMRPKPDEQVLSWFSTQKKTIFYTSAITRLEILLGLALLPEGKRRKALSDTALDLFENELAGRCLPFDILAADQCVSLVAKRTLIGRPISIQDAQIAAIALVNQLPLVTRNVKDFAEISSLIVLNPWDVVVA
jgi:hypothetical protein